MRVGRRQLLSAGFLYLLLVLSSCEKKHELEYEPVGPPRFDVRIEVTRTRSFHDGAETSTTTIGSVTINGNKVELMSPANAHRKRFDVPTRKFGIMQMELEENDSSAVPVLLLTKEQQASIAGLGKK